jgi:hypothetical protein
MTPAIPATMRSECVGAAVGGSQVRCEVNLYALRGWSRLVERKKNVVRVRIDWMNVKTMSKNTMRKSLCILDSLKMSASSAVTDSRFQRVLCVLHRLSDTRKLRRV